LESLPSEIRARDSPIATFPFSWARYGEKQREIKDTVVATQRGSQLALIESVYP